MLIECGVSDWYDALDHVPHTPLPSRATLTDIATGVKESPGRISGHAIKPHHPLLCAQESGTVHFRAVRNFIPSQKFLILDILTPSRPRRKLVTWCFEPSQPLGIRPGLKEAFTKRYVVERTSKAQIRLEEQRQKTESCRENFMNEIQLKGP